MKINMTHNDNIKTFNDIKHHLELEDDRLKAAKTSNQLYMANSKLQKALGFKHKSGSNTFQKERKIVLAQGKPNIRKHMREKRTGQKKDNIKMNYYNCGKLCHFARECIESKKGTIHLHKFKF